MKNIVVLGPPGSGKDTQIDKLLELENYFVVRAGNLVRELARKDKSAEKIIDEGGLINDDIILDLVDKQVQKTPKEQGIIFDGFPRTLYQAEKLDEILAHCDRFLDAVIYISIEEDVIVERLSSRMVCSICGENIYGQSDKCAKCGGRPIRRHDDEPAVIINRVQTFMDSTLPLVEYFRNKGKLTEINGNQTIANVARDIREKLGYAK